MKNWRILILGTVLTTNFAFAAPQPVDRVAAVVNNGVVLESEVDGMMRSVKLQARQAGQQLPDDKTLHDQIIERLIMDRIILQMGQKMGLRITDQQLDLAIRDIATKNKLTPEQMRSRLAYDGIDYNTYREQVRKEITIAEVRNSEVRRRLTILPQEVDSLAQQLSQRNTQRTELNLSHILLALPENPTQQQVDEKEAIATRLLNELKAGANFGKLAATWSNDPQALKGGQMGWGKLEELPVLFAESLSTAKKGDVIGPIRSGVGFHLLKVNDLRGENQNVTATEVHARHILLKTSPVLNDEQAKTKLSQLANDIKSGKTSFQAAAKQYSEDPGSASKGGDLGWNLPQTYDPAFRDALMRLQKGEISQPVQSSFGWHLIQPLDYRQVDKTDVVQKEQAYRLIFNRKFSEEVQTWMQEQRASAYVKKLNQNAR